MHMVNRQNGKKQMIPNNFGIFALKIVHIVRNREKCRLNETETNKAKHKIPNRYLANILN